MHKVCIIRGNSQYRQMFHNAGWEVVSDIESADLVQFTGGEDVSPSYYGEPIHPYTGFNPSRDRTEALIFEHVKSLGKAMSGICRGGQFLNVMCGGKLFQHVEGHAIYGTHEALDKATSNIRMVTSTHHQMMRVGPLGELVAVAQEATLRQSMDGDGKIVNDPLDEPDVEVVYYPEHKVLCFQPHPEFPGYEDCTAYYFELLNRYLGF